MQEKFRLLPSSSRDPINVAFGQSSEGFEDPSEVYGGYAPLSVRLVQMLYLPGSWKQGVSALDLLWGPALEISQTTVVSSVNNSSTPPNNIAVVVFLGGCTYGEIAALRYLEKIVNR